MYHVKRSGNWTQRSYLDDRFSLCLSCAEREGLASGLEYVLTITICNSNQKQSLAKGASNHGGMKQYLVPPPLFG